MNQIIAHLTCTIALTMPCRCLLAVEERAPPVQEIMICNKQELGRFFPKRVLKAVLIKDQVPQDQAETIADNLSTKDDVLMRTIREKASRMDPNPFQDLNHRDVAIKLYRESIYQEFAKVLKAHGIQDEDKIQLMLDDLQRAKSKLFLDCIRKENIASPQTDK